MSRKIFRKILAPSILVIVACISGRIYWENEQKQVYLAAQKLVSQADLERQSADLKVLNASYQNLKEAIAILETIPNTISNVHQTALADLIQLRPRLDQLKHRLATERDASANLTLSQKLAMEAATIVQNPPHPDSVWQQARHKWQQAIDCLSVIPPETTSYPMARQRLTAYEANHATIGKRSTIEQQAIKNLKTATQLGTEVTQLLQNRSYSLAQGKQTLLKCQQAINLLKKLPTGTSISTSAQVKTLLGSSQKDCATLKNKVSLENKALADIQTAQALATQAVTLTQKTPYTAETLRVALVKVSQASNLLKSIPPGLEATQKAASLRQKYVSNYTTISERLKEVEVCQKQSYCFEAETPLSLN